MSKRAKPGDVLELDAPNGLIYVQYVGKHPIYGYGILVSPKMYGERMPVHPDLFGNAYVTFYPLAGAIADGSARIVGHLPSPGLPTRMRRAGARSNTGKVETWMVDEPGRGERMTRALTDEERKLPIAGIWNHEFLVIRVSKGWKPEMEG